MAPLPVRLATLPSWQAASPAGLPPTTWPAVGWVLLFGVVVALAELPVCTATAPCSQHFTTYLELSLLVQPVAVALLPHLARVLSLSSALTWGAALWLDPAGLPLVPVTAGVVVLAVWTALAGQVVRGRQAAAELLAGAAPTAHWPGPRPDALLAPSRGEGLRIAAVLGVLGTLVLGYAWLAGAREHAQEQVADRVLGVVAGHDEDGFRLTVRARGQDLEVDTLSGAQDYPVGGEQLLLLTEDDVRLAAEPYDPSLWGSLGLGLEGLALVAGARGRRRTRALHRLLTEPQPVFAVRVLAAGDAVVLAVDDLEATGSALAAVPVERVDDDEDDEDWEGEDDVAPPPVPAVAYGLPLPGQAVALLTQDGAALLPYALARRPPPGLAAATADLPVPHWDEPGAGAVLAVLHPGPVRLGLARLGVALSLVACAVLAAQSESGLGAGLRLLVVLNLGVGCLLSACSGVALDGEGVTVDGPLRRRTVGWGSLRTALADTGDVALLTRDGEVVVLPWPSTGYGLVPRPARAVRARRAAAVLQRRIDEAVPAHGPVVVALRPLAALYAAAVVACLLLGLLVRQMA